MTEKELPVGKDDDLSVLFKSGWTAGHQEGRRVGHREAMDAFQGIEDMKHQEVVNRLDAQKVITDALSTNLSKMHTRVFLLENPHLTKKGLKYWWRAVGRKWYGYNYSLRAVLSNFLLKLAGYLTRKY